MLNPLIDAKISHVKGAAFINETVSQASVIHLQAAKGSGKFAIVFTREGLDLISESLTATGDNPMALTSAITDSDMHFYRVQVANLVFDGDAALQLHEALTNALKGAGLLNGEV
jgi:hypothetical protein